MCLEFVDFQRLDWAKIINLSQNMIEKQKNLKFLHKKAIFLTQFLVRKMAFLKC